MSPIKLFDENKTLCGLSLRHLMHQQNCAGYVAGIFDKVIALWKDGKVKSVVDSTLAIEDVSMLIIFWNVVMKHWDSWKCKTTA